MTLRLLLWQGCDDFTTRAIELSMFEGLILSRPSLPHTGPQSKTPAPSHELGLLWQHLQCCSCDATGRLQQRIFCYLYGV